MHARGCQGVEALTNMCCEESWSSETCEKRGIIFATGEESNNRESNDGSDSWIADQSKFPSQGAAVEQHTFLIRPLQFRVPEPCHAASLDCREIRRVVRILWETFFFERPLAQEGLSSTILNNSKKLPSSSLGLRLDITETARREKWKENL